MATEFDHIQRLHPWLRSRAEGVIATWRAGAAPDEVLRVVESVRSTETQQEYYARGASDKNGVTKFSLHQYSPALAMDCILLRSGKVIKSVTDPAWQRYGQLAEAEGLEWGGRWKRRDGPHIQVPLVQRIRMLQEELHVTVDGDWGPKSAAALAAFVAKAKTPSHAKDAFPVHPKTWALLCGGLL